MAELNTKKSIVLKAMNPKSVNTIKSSTGGEYGYGYTQEQMNSYQLYPEEEITLELSRLKAAGTLSFRYYDAQQEISLEMGDRIYLDVDGVPVFRGYLFEKSQTKEGLIEAVCYDCLRYLLNTDSYTRPKETFLQFSKWVAQQFEFKFEAVNDQWDSVGPLVCENESFLDMMNKYKREVVMTTSNFYEVCASRSTHNKLIFRSMAQYPWKVVLSNSIVEDFTYTETIDSDVANVIEVAYKTSSDAQPTRIQKVDTSTLSIWGPLWYIEEVQMSAGEAQTYLATLYALMRESSKSFELKGVLTDTLLVEPGSPVVASFLLDNKEISNWMLIDSITYTIKSTIIRADMRLLGNGITKS